MLRHLKAVVICMVLVAAATGMIVYDRWRR